MAICIFQGSGKTYTIGGGHVGCHCVLISYRGYMYISGFREDLHNRRRACGLSLCSDIIPCLYVHCRVQGRPRHNRRRACGLSLCSDIIPCLYVYFRVQGRPTQ